MKDRKERVAVISTMLQVGKTISRYWFDEKTNIFKNYFDAILGAIGLIILPGVSLISVIFTMDTTWTSYAFPIISICFAGIYDSYGRYEPNTSKNIKLAVRVCVDFLAILVACLFTNTSSVFFAIIAPVILLLCGFFISVEAYQRVKVAIEISEWAILGKEDDGGAL